MHRLQSDPRFEITIDYQGDFIPNPAQITLLQSSTSLQEVAEKIYDVAQHAVTYDGRYLAGSEEDRYRHRK